MRPDVREAFDLSTAKGRSGLYWWYYLHAFRDMWLDPESPGDFKGPINEPVKELPVCAAVPVTGVMQELWRRGAIPDSLPDRWRGRGRFDTIIRRVHETVRNPLFAAPEQQRLISWYFCKGMDEYNLAGLLTEEQSAILLSPAGKDGIPAVLELVHRHATDLHDRFPSAATAEWRQWCSSDGQREFSILSHPLIRDHLFPQPNTPKTLARHPGPFGVNLFGHAGTRSGVGEDLRMAARALEAAGIPFVIRDVRPSTGVAAEDPGPDACLADNSPFRINMFCMAGMETVTFLSTRRDLLDGKVNIGFWPWELPEWPKLWSHAPRLMDEIWASTSFTALAYRKSTQVPVRKMPMAVDVDATEGLARDAFRIPADGFIFGYSFDGHSSFSRKNPAGAIEAFRRAFPAGDEPVGLVLKGLRVSDHSQWGALQALAKQDPRIIVMAESLSRGALLDLYRSLDCFVSLHRSEGFGRNIAECMLLGKPVIATNYSGNVDFTRHGTAALVKSTLRTVREGEYPFGSGQLWANPCIDHATEQMRRMFFDEEWRTRIARSGQAFIESHHSAAAVGKKFHEGLSAVVQEFNRRVSCDDLRVS